MIPDEPTSQEALSVYAGAAALAKLRSVKAATKNATCGFVTWNASPPMNIYWGTHKQSFLEAVHTALVFCDTRLADEWLVVGRGMLPIIRTLPRFHEQVGAGDDEIMFIGRIGRIAVLYAFKMPSKDFCAGCGDKAARGTVTDLPINFESDPVDYPHPQARQEFEDHAPMYRAMQAVLDPDPVDPIPPELGMP